MAAAAGLDSTNHTLTVMTYNLRFASPRWELSDRHRCRRAISVWVPSFSCWARLL